MLRCLSTLTLYIAVHNTVPHLPNLIGIPPHSGTRVAKYSTRTVAMSAPRPPPAPSLFHSSIQLTSGISERHQYVAEAKDLEQEVKYLLEPLSTLAQEQGKTIFTLVHNVKPVIQQGPMCGIVAISIASQLLHGTIAQPDTLLAQAMKKCYSKQGEMFSAANLLNLAQSELNCKGSLLNSKEIEVFDILSALTEKKAIVVPYDADKDHSPCLARGHRAHWCTLVGFAVIAESLLHSKTLHVRLTPTEADQNLQKEWTGVDKSDVYLFARQGKSRHLKLWSYASLMESNANLVEVGEHRNSGSYVIPHQGLSHSLCSILISLENIIHVIDDMPS